MKERRRGRPPKAEASRSGLILEASLAAFATYGYNGASLRRIAADAGVDVALISHQFGSKLELWKAVAASLAMRFNDELHVPTIDGEQSPSDGGLLHSTLDRVVDLVCDNPQIAMFALKEVAQPDGRFDYIYTHLLKPMHDLLTPLIEHEMTGGERNIDPDFAYFGILGAIALMVVLQPFIGRFSDAATSDDRFRAALKQLVVAQLTGLRLLRF